MPERDRFLRGMIGWLGFRQVGVPYRRAPRLAGQTKYPLLRMLRFAMDGIASFSALPLRMATWLGFSASLVAAGLILYAIFVRAFSQKRVTGWTSLFMAVLFVGGAQLICLGILGEYVGRIYNEAKCRPLYFVRELVGFNSEIRVQSETARSGRQVSNGVEINYLLLLLKNKTVVHPCELDTETVRLGAPQGGENVEEAESPERTPEGSEQLCWKV